MNEDGKTGQSEPGISVPRPIHMDELDWQDSPCGTEGSRRIAIAEDADGETWLVQQDECGDWREMIDGELLGKVVPVRWAVPTWEMVDELAFG